MMIGTVLLQVNIFPMFSICFNYNSTASCRIGLYCARLHICAAYIQLRGNCPDGDDCEKSHNLRQLEAINSMPVFNTWSDLQILDFIRQCSPNACRDHLASGCLKKQDCPQVKINVHVLYHRECCYVGISPFMCRFKLKFY